MQTQNNTVAIALSPRLAAIPRAKNQILLQLFSLPRDLLDFCMKLDIRTSG